MSAEKEFNKLTPVELMNFLMSDKTLKRIAKAFDPNKWKNVDGEKFCSLGDNELKTEYEILKKPYRSLIIKTAEKFKNRSVPLAPDGGN